MSDNWRKALLRPNCTIKNALEVINTDGLRVALIVDAHQELLGVVADGDIRRGLLKGLSLDDNITNVMNATPVTASSKLSRVHLIAKMNKMDLLFLPIVSGKNLVGLVTLHTTLTNNKSYDNPVFIMAGGFGSRLKPLTNNCLKPMLKIGKKPILEIIIQQFAAFGFSNFYISTHYMPEQIHDYFGDGCTLGVKINYVYEESPLGTGGALSLLPNEVQEQNLPLIMINGDILTKIDFHHLLKFHIHNNADATMCIRRHEYQIPYGAVNIAGNKVIGLEEKPVNRYFINAGIYVLSIKIVASIPNSQYIDMPDLLEQQIVQGKKIMAFPIHEYWLDIGRTDDFNRAKEDVCMFLLD